MADSYVSVTWVANELVTSTKLNQAMTNDSGFHDGTALGDGIIVTRHLANANVTSSKLSIDLIEVKLSSGFTASASNTWQDTGMKVTLPTAGTWLVFADCRMVTNAAGQYCAVRLYDQTTSTVVTDSDRIGNLANSGGGIQTMTTIIQKVVTAGANEIIRVELQPGGAYTAGMSSDANGKSRITAIRIG